MVIKKAIIRLKWIITDELKNIKPNPSILRGAIASNFPENDLFHQHNKDGKVLYRYPRIHYRWDNPKKYNRKPHLADALIVAFGEGVEALTMLFTSDIKINLNGIDLETSEISCDLNNCKFEITNELHEYFFRSPWLPLKKENYEMFKKNSYYKQNKELNRIIWGNILSAARDLGVEFSNTVYTLFQVKKRVVCPYKILELQGFTGRLITNVDIPEDFGLGSKVSHGYGWLKRCCG